MRALLVVDVQNWGFAGDWPVPDHEALLDRIRERVDPSLAFMERTPRVLTTSRDRPVSPRRSYLPA